MITLDQLKTITRGRPSNGQIENMNSLLMALNSHGTATGLDMPHRIAHFVAQLCHESMGFIHDREIWGPTEAQKRYEGRRDLGNVNPGDGSKFRGRGPIQVTGRHNYTRFTEWAQAMDRTAPDFTVEPESLNTDPWEGLSPIWYWSVGNPTGKSLNRYADRNDIETITRRINGGLNGYKDRLRYYQRAGLVMLGYGPEDVMQFQRDSGLEADGISGPATRNAIHARLNDRDVPQRPQEAVQAPTAPPAGDLPHEYGFLRKGNRGPQVRVLQKSLKAIGVYDGDVDGIFGRNTERAVEEVQDAARLDVDGIVGPKTSDAIQSLLEASLTPEAQDVVDDAAKPAAESKSEISGIVSTASALGITGTGITSTFGGLSENVQLALIIVLGLIGAGAGLYFLYRKNEKRKMARKAKGIRA